VPDYLGAQFDSGQSGEYCMPSFAKDVPPAMSRLVTINSFLLDAFLLNMAIKLLNQSCLDL